MDRVAKDMCQALDDENFYEFLKLCYQVSHEDDYDDWEDWDDWDDYTEDIFFDSLLDTVPYALNISTEDPYRMCKSYTDLYSLDNDGIKEKANNLISAIVYYSGGWLYSTSCWRYYDWRHFWPSSWSSSWSSEVSYSFDESSTLWNYNVPSVDSLDNVLSVIFQQLGDWSSEENMCKQVASISGDPDLSDELFDLLDDMVSNILEMTTNLRSCRNFVNTMTSNGILTSEDIEEMTGYSSASDLCDFVVETFSANRIKIDAIDLPELDGYSYSDDIFGYLGEQAMESGMIAPLIPFETAVKLIAKMYNANNFPEMSEIVCDVMGEYLSRVHGMGDVVEPICRIFTSSGSDPQDLISDCEESLIPAYYGPDYPTALREFDVEKLLDFISDYIDIDLSVLEDEDPQGICVAAGDTVKEILTSDMSILDFGKVTMVDIGTWMINEYGMAFCEQIDQIRSYLEDLEWWDNYGQWWYWDSSVEEFDYYRDTPRFLRQEDLDIMDDIMGVLTGMGSMDRVCDSMVDSRDDLEGYMEFMADQVIGILENVDRCERFVDTIEDIIMSGDIFEGGNSWDVSWESSWTWWSSSAPYRMDIDDILRMIGFEGKNDLCLAVVQAFTEETVGKCTFNLISFQASFGLCS